MNKKNKKRIVALLMSFFIVISMISVGDISAKAANDEYVITVNTTQYYAIANLGSRLQLNVANNGTKNGTNVNLSKWTGGSGQTFKFTKTSLGYTITPKCNSNSRINVYGNSSKEGSNICLWNNTNHSTQAFIVEYVKSKDAFILRSANNRNYVLTAESTKAGANVKLSKYNANNNNQYWFTKSLTATKKKTTQTKPAASTLKISGQNTIGTINAGSYVTIKGTVSSNYNLNYVNAYILKSDGKTFAVDPAYSHQLKNTKSYPLANSAVDRALAFNKLSVGTYYYKVTAQDTSGKASTLVYEKFTVKAKPVSNNSKTTVNSQTITTAKINAVLNQYGYTTNKFWTYGTYDGKTYNPSSDKRNKGYKASNVRGYETKAAYYKGDRNWNGYVYLGQEECYGFACFVMSKVTNTEVRPDINRSKYGWSYILGKDVKELKVGDIVRAHGHSAIVYSVNGDNVRFAEVLGSGEGYNTNENIIKINSGFHVIGATYYKFSDLKKSGITYVYRYTK